MLISIQSAKSEGDLREMHFAEVAFVTIDSLYYHISFGILSRQEAPTLTVKPLSGTTSTSDVCTGAIPP